MKKGENIYKRKDGRWEARYKNGYHPNGKTRYQSIYGKSYSEVKQKLDEIKCQTKKPIQIKRKSMNDVYKSYMESIRFYVKASTMSNYRNLYDNHLAKTFGGCLISKIDTMAINDFITKKLASGILSTKFISDIVCLLKALLHFAMKQNWIDNTNFDIIRFKVTSTLVEVFNDEEKQAIEKEAITNQTRLNFGVLISLCTGLRIGEICALKVGDIDLNNGIIHVTKTMQRIKNPIVEVLPKTIISIDSPKSKTSIRDISLPTFMVLLLKNAISHKHNNAYFLTGELDKFTEPRVLESHFKRFLKRIGAPYKKFHTLRHTFATYGIRNNIFDLKTLSEILGHSSIKITYNNYIHSDSITHRNQMQRLNSDFISRQEIRHSNKKSPFLGASNPL